MRAWMLVLISSFILILTGCSALAPTPLDTLSTVTPLPTVNPLEGLRVTVSTACLLRSYPSIQVDDIAGDMMAWDPTGDLFAYVAPINSQWGWYNGNLTILSMETGETRATRDIKAAGDLTWSPDGNRIAFRALQSSERIYTIDVLLVSDFTILDLYASGAATDEFGSEKNILRWADNNRVQVIETCGVDCSRVVEISLIGQEKRVLSSGREQDNTGLRVDLAQGGMAANPDWFLANASPDDTRIFYADDDDQAWLVSPDEGFKFRIELDFGDVQESKWSPDSKLLAVRTDEMIFIYDLECAVDWAE